MKGEFVMLSKFISSLKQEFGGYNAAALTKDLMAGLTVAAVALPLALAFGVSSGADAASGLITPSCRLIMSLLSGGYYQISGPTGAMAAILMSLVAAYGMDGVFIATLIAGIILLLAGILHLGKLTSFIPPPLSQALPPVSPLSSPWDRLTISSEHIPREPLPSASCSAIRVLASPPI